MAEFDGRHELRLFYETTISSRVIPHRFTIDFQVAGGFVPVPGGGFLFVDTPWHNGAANNLEDSLTDLMNVFTDLFGPGTTFLTAEYWFYDPEPSSNATFIDVVALAGTGTAVSDQTAQQQTMTFRTKGGGIMRCQFMEGGLGGNNVDAFPFTDNDSQLFALYMSGTLHPWVGRDDTRPIAPLRNSLGQNEKLWRRRFRE